MHSGRFVTICVILLVCLTGLLFAAENLELYIRPYILPDSHDIASEDLFLQSKSSGYGTAEVIEPLDRREAVEQVFGGTAAIIPVWQFRSLIYENDEQSVSAEKHIILVGNSAIYIPENIRNKVERSILQVVLGILKKRSLLQNRRIEFFMHRTPSTLMGADILDIELLDFHDQSGRLRMICTGIREGREVTAVAEGTVTIYKAYPTAARDIRPDEVFFMTDAVFRAEPEGSIPSTVELSHEGAYVAARSIQQGEVLTAWNTKPKYLVQTGDRVVVIVQRGNVQMRMPGISRGSGLRGEIVPVRLNSGFIRNCTVQYEGEVHIEE